MTSKVNKAKARIVLHKRIIVADGLVFDAEREVHLPIQPFVGLMLYNAEWIPPGCDMSEDPIEEVGYDLETGEVFVFLPCSDYRVESSGSDDWTEEEVREKHRDWVLKRDESVKPRKAARSNHQRKHNRPDV